MFVLTRGSGGEFKLPCDVRVRVVAVYRDHVDLAFDGPADVQPCYGNHYDIRDCEELSFSLEPIRSESTLALSGAG